MRLNFREYMEAWGKDSYARSFVSAHFKEPAKTDNLLIWADWLDENGHGNWAEAIREILQGHDEQGSDGYGKRTRFLLKRLYADLTQVEFREGGTTFAFPLNTPNLYRVGVNGTLQRWLLNSWQPLPEEEWTPDVVEAAVYLALKRLSENPPRERTSGPPVEPQHARPADMMSRHVYQAIIQFMHDQQYVYDIMQARQLGTYQYGMGWVNHHYANLLRDANELLPLIWEARKKPESLKPVAALANRSANLMGRILHMAHDIHAVSPSARLELAAADLQEELLAIGGA